MSQGRLRIPAFRVVNSKHILDYLNVYRVVRKYSAIIRLMCYETVLEMWPQCIAWFYKRSYYARIAQFVVEAKS